MQRFPHRALRLISSRVLVPGWQHSSMTRRMRGV